MVIIGLAAVVVIGVGFFLSPQDKLEPSDAIVVISGGETRERVEEGARLYRDGWAPLMIMSGAARDEGTANAVAMKQLAVSLGVSANDILVEPEALDTFENAAKVRVIIEEHRISRFILVTSPYHQRRAALVFSQVLESLPVTIVNHSSLDSAWRKNGWWWNSWARRLTGSELKKIIYTALVPFQDQR